MEASILAIGSEILDGRVLDTNSQYVTSHLTALGIRVREIAVCDDVESEIVEVLERLAKSTSVIITSGGLGPTTDDLTREAIAAFFHRHLVFNEESFTKLKLYFEKRKRTFDPSNRQQAYFPEHSSIIPNESGSAEGFIVHGNVSGKDVVTYSLPGVPTELRMMFETTVCRDLKRRYPSIREPSSRTFKTFGLPESVVGSRTREAVKDIPVTISYRAHFPEIEVKIKGEDSNVERAFQLAVVGVGADHVFTKSAASTMVQEVHRLLLAKGATISVAESCTGGLLGSYLSTEPGSSKYFIGGIISYSNEVKTVHLHVNPETIRRLGAVSEETAKEMAEGIKRVTKSDWGISITGIAGPDGGTEEKPVGTFYVGIVDQRECTAYKYFLPTDRTRMRKFAAYVALDVLRRKLLGFSVSTYSMSS